MLNLNSYTPNNIKLLVSMLDGFLFDKLELIARKIRNSNLPFGGIQVILIKLSVMVPRGNVNSIFIIDNCDWRLLSTSSDCKHQ